MRDRSRRASGDTCSTGMRTCARSSFTSPRRRAPPPVSRTRAMGTRPGRVAKYCTEFRISPTSSAMAGCTALSAARTWGDSSPSRRLSASASTSGRSSEDATAAVAALPPVPMVRTNWGRPCWWTTTTVSPAPIDTMASGRSAATEGSPSARTRAEDTRSTPSTTRPAFSAAPTTPSTRSRCAAATRTRRVFDAVGGGAVGEDLGGEDGLVRREGDDLLGLEAHRAVEVLVGHPGKVDLTRDGAQAGDADHDRLGLELAVLPQADDGVGHRRGVLDLAVDDGARRQATWPKATRTGAPAPNSSSAARTALVPMSRPTTCAMTSFSWSLICSHQDGGCAAGPVLVRCSTGIGTAGGLLTPWAETTARSATSPPSRSPTTRPRCEVAFGHTVTVGGEGHGRAPGAAAPGPRRHHQRHGDGGPQVERVHHRLGEAPQRQGARPGPTPRCRGGPASDAPTPERTRPARRPRSARARRRRPGCCPSRPAAGRGSSTGWGGRCRDSWAGPPGRGRWRGTGWPSGSGEQAARRGARRQHQAGRPDFPARASSTGSMSSDEGLGGHRRPEEPPRAGEATVEGEDHGVERQGQGQGVLGMPPGHEHGHSTTPSARHSSVRRRRSRRGARPARRRRTGPSSRSGSRTGPSTSHAVGWGTK